MEREAIEGDSLLRALSDVLACGAGRYIYIYIYIFGALVGFRFALVCVFLFIWKRPSKIRPQNWRQRIVSCRKCLEDHRSRHATMVQ